MLLKDFIEDSRKRLCALYPVEEAKAMVGVVCSECLGVQSYAYLINPSLVLKKEKLEKAEDAIAGLCSGEPLQYILGFADFFGRRFKVDPSVLIPRPETELLCKYALESAMIEYRNRQAYGKNAVPLKVLDLCTGSGCVAWTMAAEIPGSEITAVDISSEALSVAASQEFRGVRSPVFIQADIFDEKAMEDVLADSYDVILSNPPYIMESEKSAMNANVLDHEPHSALFVPDNDPMVFNRKIAEICKKSLYTDGVAFVEINEALGGDVKGVFEENGFKSVETIHDLNGKDRFVKFTK